LELGAANGCIGCCCDYEQQRNQHNHSHNETTKIDEARQQNQIETNSANTL